MMKFSFNILIISLPLFSFGQDDTLYYSQISLEETYELFLLPNNRFLYAIDAGGLLFREYGEWQLDSNKIVLTTDFFQEYPNIPNEGLSKDTNAVNSGIVFDKSIWVPDKFHLDLGATFQMQNNYILQEKLIAKPK